MPNLKKINNNKRSKIYNGADIKGQNLKNKTIFVLNFYIFLPNELCLITKEVFKEYLNEG